MNILIFFIIFILIIILLFFVFKSKTTVNKKNKHLLTKRVIQNFDIYSAKIPKKIKELDTDTLLEIISERFKVFTVLDYASKKENELYEKEWNSWEVSIFIYMLQKNRNILIPEPQNLFHKSILRLNKKQVEQELKNIVLKYNKISTNEPFTLKNQIIWSKKEISIIFYYFVLIKEFSENTNYEIKNPS